MLSHHPVFVVFLVAVIAPLLAQTRPGARVPVIVFEVLLGIVIGPHVLGIIGYDEFLAKMRDAGMVAVLFMAGMEMDFAQIRGRPLTLAAGGWLISVLLAFMVVGVLRVIPGVQAPMMVVVALATTGLGALLPILRDGGLLEAPFGRMLIAAGTLGEVTPIVAASLALSDRYSTWQEFLFLLVFLGLVALVAAVGIGARPPRVLAILGRTMHSSTQLPVRLALLIMGALILVAEEFGFESVFGAFAAGMIVGLATRGPDGEPFRVKIDAVFFGWLEPFFYVGTGIAFDLSALTSNVTTMVLVPSFLLLFLLVRGLPVFLYRRDLAKGELLPFALSSGIASLSLVVVITHVGLQTKHMNPDIAQALVGAAVLSLMVYPALAKILLSRAQPAASAAGSS